MQIVIDIPEEFYNDILNHVGGQQGITAQALVAWKAVERGTPLPKGHGKIVDIKPLMIGLYEGMGKETYTPCEIYKMLEEDCRVIIEADKKVDECGE